jgi:hypothetical protein
MAVSRICDGGVGVSGASAAMTNTGTASLSAGDEVAVVIIIRDATLTVTGFTDFGTIASPSTNGGAEQLDVIAHDGSIRTELWRLSLTATGASAATWTISFSATANGNAVYGAFNGADATTPFVWTKLASATSSTSIPTTSIDPDRTGCLLLVSGAGGGYTVAPTATPNAHTAHADLGTALENRTAGTGAGSWRTLSLWGMTLPDASATTAYTLTDSQTHAHAHGYQILAQPPLGGWTTSTPPDAILGMHNLTGSLTDIDDDPDSPDANWLVVG